MGINFDPGIGNFFNTIGRSAENSLNRGADAVISPIYNRLPSIQGIQQKSQGFFGWAADGVINVGGSVIGGIGSALSYVWNMTFGRISFSSDDVGGLGSDAYGRPVAPNGAVGAPAQAFGIGANEVPAMFRPALERYDIIGGGRTPNHIDQGEARSMMRNSRMQEGAAFVNDLHQTAARGGIIPLSKIQSLDANAQAHIRSTLGNYMDDGINQPEAQHLLTHGAVAETAQFITNVQHVANGTAPSAAPSTPGYRGQPVSAPIQQQPVASAPSRGGRYASQSVGIGEALGDLAAIPGQILSGIGSLFR